LPEDTLITPVTPYEKRIRYRVIEFDELIDSANITVKQQMEIAQCIFDNYKQYDGFVILHGEDTMAYTASLLSFVLENLQKTVCLTGSQLPLTELRNDSLDNLLGALLVAGAFLIPEVVLYFSNKLFRGNRASKVSAASLAAYNSVNLDPLGAFGVTFDVRWDLVLQYPNGHIELSKTLEEEISYLVISPCLNIRTLELALQNSKAVVISGYGMGNIPTQNDKLMKVLKQAVDNGVIVCIKTQCGHGGVNEVYETGKKLSEMGCVLTADMTIECIFAKLMYLMGKVSFGRNKIGIRNRARQNDDAKKPSR
jgi:lysophospholipase